MAATAKKNLMQTVDGQLKLPVYSADGERTGTVVVEASELGGKINQQLLHDAVLMYESNRRRGTHSTKSRGEVAGSTIKLFRQKGTGRARIGNRRTNKRRGGGTAKGPKPRDYEYHMPKKAVRSATRMALLSKFRDEVTIVVEGFRLEEISTGAVAEILENLEIDGVSCLIGLGKGDIDEEQTIHKSSRNIPWVDVSPASQFNTYALLRPKCLLLTKGALEELCKQLNWTDDVPESGGSDEVEDDETSAENEPEDDDNEDVNDEADEEVNDEGEETAEK